MIKYKFINKKPNPEQNGEIQYYLKSVDFLKVLELAKRYYIQGYFADYEFILEMINNIKHISIRIY